MSDTHANAYRMEKDALDAQIAAMQTQSDKLGRTIKELEKDDAPKAEPKQPATKAKEETK